ncbi:MAG: DUF885 domain-containing protein [Alphaproteobacteria bacterium]|nr:DUF885 domain-containing protein [Alphaproteobacteria bacterium]
MHKAVLPRRTTLALIGASGAALALPSCARAAGSTIASPPPADAASLLDAVAWRLLEIGPEGATHLALDTGEHAHLRHRLSDNSPTGIAKLVALLKSDLALVGAVDRSALDPMMLTSLAVVETAYDTALEGFALPYGDVAVGGWRNTPYIVIQNVGAYLDVPRFLDSSHPVRTGDDAEAYCDRLSQMPRQLDAELERIASAEALGLVPPDFLLARTIDQMGRSIAGLASGGGTLVSSLAQRTATIPGDWQRRAERIVADGVLPALERQHGVLKRQMAKADAAPGMGTRPHGPEWYAWALKASTTTGLTPDEVHARGLDELAAIQTKMDPILHRLGYTKGSTGERMAALAKDRRYQFPDNDEGRAEVIAFIQQRLDWIRAQMPNAFSRLAPGNVEVRRLPPAEELGAPSAYGGAGSIDGSIPGRMWINLHTTDLHRKYDLPTLVHHEAIPGHVWQGEYTRSMPLIRSMLAFNPYSEGWALYAEQLGDELGAYDDFPAGRLGYLQNQGWRAARMVIDTGLHSKDWSRDRAIAWFRSEVGLSPAETANEVDRYCSWPGQACGYKVGHSEMVRLREKARATLGDKFDLRTFNQVVIDGGNVALNVLAQIVERYVSQTRNA